VDQDSLVNQVTRVHKVLPDNPEVQETREFRVNQVIEASLVHQDQLGYRVLLDLPERLEQRVHLESLDNLVTVVHKVCKVVRVPEVLTDNLDRLVNRVLGVVEEFLELLDHPEVLDSQARPVHRVPLASLE